MLLELVVGMRIAFALLFVLLTATPVASAIPPDGLPDVKGMLECGGDPSCMGICHFDPEPYIINPERALWQCLEESTVI